MKARWIRNAPDAMSSLYETEGGPLPRYVAAFPELDGTVTLYEADIDGRFKKANALKGSGAACEGSKTLQRMGYVVDRGGCMLYPVGHEHAPRLDRKQALDRASEVSRDAEKRARAYFADACMMLLAGDAVAKFEELFTAGTYALDSSDSAAATRRAIGKTTYDAECSKLIAGVGAFRVADAKDRADRALSLLRRGGAYGNGAPVVDRNYFVDADGVDAYTRELDRMNAELAAKQHGVRVNPIMDPRETFKYNADDSPLYIGKDRAPGLCTLTPADPVPGVYLDINFAQGAPTPPRPLWERALVAGSPEAPRVDHRSALWIGRGLDAFRFGDIAIPMDMIGSQTTWDEMAMEVYRAWIALKPGEQILNYIGRRSWCASTVIRPEVLP